LKLLLVIFLIAGLAMQGGISVPQMISFSFDFSNDFYTVIPEASAQTPSNVYRGDIFQDVTNSDGSHTQTIGLPRFISDGNIVNIDGKFNGAPNYVPYRIWDKENYITYETGTISWTFDKNSCTAKLYSSGHVR
jgi:hypothetical protein